MKIIQSLVTLYSTILILLGGIFQSQAQEITNCLTGFSYHQDLKSELNTPNDKSTSNKVKQYWGGWLQLGLGLSYTEIYNHHNPSDYITLKPSGNFKYNNYIFSIGLDKSAGFPVGWWYTDTYWSTLGYSTNLPYSEASISVGPSHSKWKYYTENDNRDIINSSWNLGLIVQAQLLIHMRIGAGIGCIVTLNYSKEVGYVSFSLVLALGAWHI